MIVPDMLIDIELNEAHASFHHAPSNQAATAIRICRFFTNAVQFLSVFGLLRNVGRIAGRQLHARGEFITGGPRGQNRLVRMSLQMDLIKLRDEAALKFSYLSRAIEIKVSRGTPHISEA